MHLWLQWILCPQWRVGHFHRVTGAKTCAHMVCPAKNAVVNASVDCQTGEHLLHTLYLGLHSIVKNEGTAVQSGMIK